MAEVEARPMVLEEFLPFVGQELIADCDPEPVALKLVEASPLRPNGLEGRPPFILVFYTRGDTFLVPGGYVMRRKDLEPALIHIGDMMPPPNAEPGYYYQAIFN